MIKIDYNLLITGIKDTLKTLKLSYLGTYPEALNRVGNNYPCYAIRFPNEVNNNDQYVNVLSTSIEVTLYILTKDNTNRVAKQNEIEENILELLLNNPTLGIDCVNNIEYVSTDRGDYNEGNSSYQVGYYSNNNIETMTFNLWLMRTV